MNSSSLHSKEVDPAERTDPVLIVPYMWIGDFVRVHSVIKLLKARWPNRPIDLLTSSLCAPILDYLPGAASAGLIPKETAYGIESLFKEADNFLKPLTCQQQDALMKERPEIVREWQKRMAIYIKQIEAHNNRLQSKND